jgi:hypothetical protein
MTSRLLSLVPVIVSISNACAQNLVPNGSFEQLSTCPDNWEQVDHATGWSSYRGSPDLYNACSPGTSFSVPSNLFGTVGAAEGSGYVGLYTYLADLENRREYVGRALSAPLVPGVLTQVTFKVTSCGGGGALFSQQYWCNGIGVRFSMSQWYQPEFTTSTLNEADVFAAQVVPFSSNWYTVSGTFVPDSAYTHIVLGNFFGDGLTVVQNAVPPGSTPGAYYFVDDICVTQGGAQTCHLITSVQNNDASAQRPAYFDPTDGSIHVPVGSRRAVVDLLDASGRIARTDISGSSSREVTFSANDLSSGVYVVNVHGVGRSRIVIP